MIGGLMGGGMASVGAGSSIIKSTIGYKNIKSNLKETKYKDLSGMFDPTGTVDADTTTDTVVEGEAVTQTEGEIEVDQTTEQPVSNKDITDKTRSNRSSKTSKQENVETSITPEETSKLVEAEFDTPTVVETVKTRKPKATPDQQADNAFNVLQNPQTEKFLNTELKRKVESGQMTTDKSNEIKANFKAKQGAANRIADLGYTGQNRAKVIDLLAEKSSLEATVKKTQDAELTRAESDRINEINSELRLPRS